jgi:hypothetical protein
MTFYQTPRIFRTLGLIAALMLAPALPQAETLGSPTEEVILTVSGNIHMTNDAADNAVFDLEMLQKLPQTEFTTTTIWTEGPQTFTGVELRTFLDALAANGETVEATAINDYAVDIPISDAVEGGPILAYLMNGKEMSRREKGPIWLVYPYDKESDYRSETIYSRSIWQLDRLKVQ